MSFSSKVDRPDKLVASGMPLSSLHTSPSDGPKKVYLEVTTRCNLDCGMCIRHVWQEVERDMSVSTFHTLLAQIKAMPNVSVIQLGGFGEPTVHPDFCEFVLALKKAQLRVELITNAVNLDRKLSKALVEAGLDKLVVSIDGVGPQYGSAFHGQGADAALKNVGILNALRHSRRSTRPEIGLALVATRKNLGQLTALRRLAGELGASSILVTNLVPYTAELADEVLYQQWSTTCRTHEPSPWNPVIELPRMDASTVAGKVIEDMCAPGKHVRMGGGYLAGGKMECRFVNQDCLAIDPHGAVSPCLPLLHSHQYFFRSAPRRIRAYHVGNINEHALSEIWNRTEYRAFRQRVRNFEFAPCIDCGSCDLRESNEADCFGNERPCCGECLWAAGVVQCP